MDGVIRMTKIFPDPLNEKAREKTCTAPRAITVNLSTIVDNLFFLKNKLHVHKYVLSSRGIEIENLCT